MASPRSALVAVLSALSALSGCPAPMPAPTDAGSDAGRVIDATADGGEGDAAGEADGGGTDGGGVGDAAAGCLAAHPAGDRYPVGDGCNFCECDASGVETCTERTCVESMAGCIYAETEHGYGERFPSTDGCNECVCAASGLACTRRPACGGLEEGAILVESLDETCGADPTFTARAVIEGLPTDDFEAPFLYERARPSYPETLPDTTIRFRIVRENGDFVVCRLPSPDQPAFDLEVTIEWITADGAFDEGLPAYLRRNGFGFVDAWLVAASAPLGGLSGTYTPNCALDPGDYAFEAQIEPDGHATGSVGRVCETDLFFTVGTFDRAAP